MPQVQPVVLVAAVLAVAVNKHSTEKSFGSSSWHQRK